jgi:hypothetical protein
MTQQATTRKPTVNDWCEAPLQIWLGKDGAIHYDSTFEKRWPGSWERLMSVVADNCHGDSGRIDWCGVQDEYESVDDEGESGA